MSSQNNIQPGSPLVVIVGPTAVGKTEVSIQLAERLDGEIISTDSRLFYRGMDIGTAKPSREEQKRAPHHLIDVAEPDEVWSLAMFQQEARRLIDEIAARGRLPFLVGGTGQYIRAVIEAWDVPQVEPDPRLRKTLEDWTEIIGKEGLHQRLAVLDLDAALQIDARNLRRTVRALEVIFRTGERFSQQRQRQKSPYNLIILGIQRTRSELYARIDERIEKMLEAGLVDEVRQLLDKGYSPDLPSLSAIGYRQIISYLHRKISLEEAVRQIKRDTRVYVRRQANWFKPEDPDIAWFNAGPGTVDAMEREIRQRL